MPRGPSSPLEARLLMAAGGKGGGDSSGSVPGGTIYYADYVMVDFNNNQYPSFTGVYSMKGDGSAKTLVSTESLSDTTHLLHNGERWSLGIDSVPGVAGTGPNGAGGGEVFATRLSDGYKVQLTDNPNVQPSYQVFWSDDDSFISYSAVTWTQVTSADSYNHVDSAGNYWLADAAVFRANIAWGSEPAAGTPAAVLDVGEQFPGWGGATPDVAELDWSPQGTQLAYQKTIGDSNTLHVASFNADLTQQLGTVNLGPGRQPEFSPDGSRIAYSAPSPDSPYLHALWTVSPNGSGVVRLTKTAQMSDSNPGWSPDGKQIAFSRHTLPKGYQPGLSDVMRLPATGGSPINLTKDTEYSAAIGWGADIEAPTTAAATTTTTTSSAGPTSLFSNDPVSKSDELERSHLLDLLV